MTLDVEKDVANTGSWTNDSESRNTYIEISDNKVRLLEYGGIELRTGPFSL